MDPVSLLTAPDFHSFPELALQLLLLATVALLAVRVRAFWWQGLILALLVGSWLVRLGGVAALVVAAAGWVLAFRRPAAPPVIPLDRVPPRGGASAFLISLVALLLASVLVHHYLNDGADAWWWLNEGRAIAEHGITTTEWFTWTAADVPAPPQEWLSARAAYWLYSIGDVTLLRGAAIVAAVLPAFFLLLAAGRSLSWSTAAWLVLGYQLMSREYFLRAELSVLPLFAAGYLLTAAWGENRLALKWYLPLLAAVTALWANCHLSFFLALIFPGAVLAERLLQRERGAAAAAAGIVAFLAGALVNPFGWRIYRFLGGMLATHGVQRLDIFQPPEFGQGVYLLALGWLVALVVGLLSGRFPLRERLWLAVCILAFLYARRNLVFLVLVSILPLSRLADRRPLRWLWPAFLAILVLSSGYYARPLHPDLLSGPGPGIAYLLERPDQRVFNHYLYGGRLGWYAYPRRLVFIDGRNHIFEKNGVWDDYLKVHFLEPGWEQVLEKYRIDAVFWPDNTELVGKLEAAGWRRAGGDPRGGLVLVRP